MAATTFNVHLSPAEKARLSQAGVNAYAVYFTDKGAKPHWTDIVVNGVPVDNATVTIDQPYIGGKLYFLVQSVDPAKIAAHDLKKLITEEGRIQWDHAGNTLPPTDPHYDAPSGAVQQQYSYDSIEITLSGKGGTDAGNLTSVNGFATPMEFKVFHADGSTDSRGYNIDAGNGLVTGTGIFSQIAAINKAANGNLVATFTDGPLKDSVRMVASPTAAVANNSGITGFSTADWTGYLDALKTYVSGQADPKIVISGYFNGAASVETLKGASYNLYHNGGFYAYGLSWNNTANAFDLSPLTKSSPSPPPTPSQVKGTIRISEADLANSIYSTLGSATILDDKLQPFTTINTGANNQWGAVLRDFLTGFTAGYYGSTATSIDATQSPIDLSKEYNWDPTYAFFSNVSAANQLKGATSDKYAKIFFDSTNSYGTGYSDNLTKAFSVGPLISVSDGKADVGRIDVTLFSPSDKPPAVDMGYKAPVIHNNIAGPYVAPTQFVGDGLNFTLSLFNSQMAPVQTMPIGIAFFEKMGPDNKPVFSKPVFLPTSATETPYQNWNLTGPSGLPYSGFDYTFTKQNVLQPIGSVLINGVPAGVGTNWYQITVGSKVFNIFAEGIDVGGGKVQFANTAFKGQEAMLASDGLAIVTPEATTAQTVGTFTVNFSSGGAQTYDAFYMAQITDAATINNPADGRWVAPYAPVLGRLNQGAFAIVKQSAGYTPTLTPNGYTNLAFVDPAVKGGYQRGVVQVPGDVTDKSIAFGWWGADPNWTSADLAGKSQVLDHTAPNIVWDGKTDSKSRWNPAVQGNDGEVVGGFTNKVGALNVAQITFLTAQDASGHTYTSHSPIAVKADVDGAWQTGSTSLAPGWYKAVLQEFSPSDLTKPLNMDSDAVIFHVASSAHANGGFLSTVASNTIKFDAGTSSAEGAWVHLDATGSTLGNATLYVFFTDAAGTMLDRSDNPTTSIQDAVRAHIGLVKTDGGALMFGGTQNVYLPAGLHMKFAIQVGDDVIKALPDIQVGGTGTLSVSVADTAGTINLSATIDDSPGANAALARSQQDHNLPWVHLDAGQSVQIDVAGSAFDFNAVHLLRIDHNPTDPDNTANWSVGGVAWANTDAFRGAVQANWEAGYSAFGGRGNFQDSKFLTVATAGFYAPVLSNEHGDTFVVGTTANVDGRSHIRVFGENMFGFEDTKGGDWDYNDLVMHITVL